MPEGLPSACVPFMVRMTSHGVSFEISASSEPLLQAVCLALPPFSRVSRAKRVARRFAIRSMETCCACGAWHDTAMVRDGTKLVRTAQGDAAALDALRLWVKHFVASAMPQAICVHAGVVALGGAAVMIPGRSMSGKTTLVAALIRAGATYYSDEYAVIGPTGLIRPFPQDLGMRRPGDPAQVPVNPSALGGRVGSRPVRARLVAFTRFADGMSWTPRTMSQGETVMALLGHTVAPDRRPARTMAWLTGATADAVGLDGARGDADATARQILARMDALGRVAASESAAVEEIHLSRLE